MNKMSNVWHFVDGVLTQYTDNEYEDWLKPYPHPVTKVCCECGDMYPTTHKRSIRCNWCQIRSDF